MSWLESRRVPFSWSHGRDQLFGTCLRRYYWRYYAPYGGNAPWETADRELIYLLGRLTSDSALVGDAVHRVARDALRNAQNGFPWAADNYVATAQVFVRRAIRRSERTARAPVVRQGRSAAILDAHYYRLPFEEHREQETLERAAGYTRGLQAHPLFQQALAHPGDLLAIYRIDRYKLLGVVVYTVPDLVQRLPNGKHRLVDWKTGRTIPQHLEAHAQQLGVYALGAQHKWEVAAEAIETFIADLHSGASVEVPLDGESLRRAEGRIVSSILAMQSRLRDLSLNQAHADDYPMMADPSTPLDSLPAICQRCAYRLPCYGERTLGWDGAR